MKFNIDANDIINKIKSLTRKQKLILVLLINVILSICCNKCKCVKFINDLVFLGLIANIAHILYKTYKMTYSK